MKGNSTWDYVLFVFDSRILLFCDNVTMEFVGNSAPEFKGTKQGRLYLTTHRMIFNNKEVRDALQSFSFPFVTLSDVSNLQFKKKKCYTQIFVSQNLCRFLILLKYYFSCTLLSYFFLIYFIFWLKWLHILSSAPTYLLQTIGEGKPYIFNMIVVTILFNYQLQSDKIFNFWGNRMPEEGSQAPFELLHESSSRVHESWLANHATAVA